MTQHTNNAAGMKSTEQELYEQWRDDYALTYEPNYDEHLEADCRAAFLAGMQAARRAQVVPELTEAQIREILLAHGFTIKDGLTDLKPYVYEAARALLAAAPQPTEVDSLKSENRTTKPDAAPVQLPALESRIDVLEVAKELEENIIAFGDTKGKAKANAVFYLRSQYEQILRWEQQVRQLLAEKESK